MESVERPVRLQQVSGDDYGEEITARTYVFTPPERRYTSADNVVLVDSDEFVVLENGQCVVSYLRKLRENASGQV